MLSKSNFRVTFFRKKMLQNYRIYFSFEGGVRKYLATAVTLLNQNFISGTFENADSMARSDQ